MTNQPLIIIARFKAKSGMEIQVKQDLLDMIAPSRAEEGCIAYDLHQDTTDPCVFVLYEIWQSQAALDFHLETPYFKHIKEAFATTLAEPFEAMFLDKIV
jgi:quinol monooxygenase YgiN